jgi:hypothetical protein
MIELFFATVPGTQSSPPKQLVGAFVLLGNTFGRFFKIRVSAKKWGGKVIDTYRSGNPNNRLNQIPDRNGSSRINGQPREKDLFLGFVFLPAGRSDISLIW